MKPFGVAALLVATFVLWPARWAPEPPPPTCQELTTAFAFRFHPLSKGRLRPLEERVLALTLPAECQALWAADPPRAWDLVRLERRPRRRVEYPPRRYADPEFDWEPGRFLAPTAET